MLAKFKHKLLEHLDDYYRSRSEELELDGFYIGYGTAGFRGNASKIERLFFKVGLISTLRCLKLNANIGVMITASHNPIEDNGVKLIDSNGEMLAPEWESIVEQYCNLNDKEALLFQTEQIIKQHKIQISNKSAGRIYIAYDTRPSSKILVGLVKRALDGMSELVEYVDYGQLTTPALHFLVAESNKRNISIISLDEYYCKLLIDGLVTIYSKEIPTSNNYVSSQLVVDCANGVGFETMKTLLNNKLFNKYLPLQLINTGEGTLNYLSGADYVKTHHMSPNGANQIGKRYASLDGDADRLVYFYLEETNKEQLNNGKIEFKLCLLDGDKIMALFALYLGDLLSKSQLNDKLSFAIVQTAYANGASTDFMRKELNLKVEFADTGVKNLHRVAKDYDVAVYFEANGHGTIWLSAKAKSLISSAGDENGLNHLKNLLSILNNYTGDAVSDILIVETILRHYDWDVKKWYNLYSDRPSSLTKVKINDRSCIKTTNAGQTCVEPENLQAEIDNLVKDYGCGARCFVRASGTENVVRIYAEAQIQKESDELALKVGDKVKELCNR